MSACMYVCMLYGYVRRGSFIFDLCVYECLHGCMLACMQVCAVALSTYLFIYACVYLGMSACNAGMHVIGTYTYLFGLACTHTHTRTQTPNKVVRLLTRYGSPYTHSMSQTTVPGKVPSPKHRVSESRCKTSRCPCPELQVPVSENSQPYGHGLGLHTSFPCSKSPRTPALIEI